MVIAVLALLIGLLLPALAAARESGRAARCLANLKQMAIACLAYADENRGVGPAIGQPYTAYPNWAFVVQHTTGFAGETPGEVYTRRSVLVCPTVDGAYAEDMTRTYAMNGTGHAGPMFSDPDDYDDAGKPGHIRSNRGTGVPRPSETPLFLDSATDPYASNPAPPTRTAGIIDFRNEAHVPERLGKFHARNAIFQVAMFDGAARALREVAEHWKVPLP